MGRGATSDPRLLQRLGQVRGGHEEVVGGDGSRAAGEDVGVVVGPGGVQHIAPIEVQDRSVAHGLLLFGQMVALAGAVPGTRGGVGEGAAPACPPPCGEPEPVARVLDRGGFLPHRPPHTRENGPRIPRIDRIRKKTARIRMCLRFHASPMGMTFRESCKRLTFHGGVRGGWDRWSADFSPPGPPLASSRFDRTRCGLKPALHGAAIPPVSFTAAAVARRSSSVLW